MGWLQQPHSRKEGREDCSVLALRILSDRAVFDQAGGKKGSGELNFCLYVPGLVQGPFVPSDSGTPNHTA